MIAAFMAAWVAVFDRRRAHERRLREDARRKDAQKEDRVSSGGYFGSEETSYTRSSSKGVRGINRRE